MNPVIPQFENDSELMKAVNDFIDSLESIGIEAEIDIDKDGTLLVAYQKPASIPNITKNKMPIIKTPEDGLDLDVLLRGTETQMNDLFTGLAMQNDSALPDVS